uniref:Putative ovule protein n=1 Tax=Solanum chacoense TaxID=4108 RepID=A0A0V0ILS4_SOLCH
MRPTGSIDKGKGVASASDTYTQTLLGNMKFRPQTTSVEMMDRMYFGKHNLICYPNFNLSFRDLPECVLDKPQKCLADNLWMTYNKKDNKYFIASLNALCQYFTDKSRENKFKYYVVIHGKTNVFFKLG